MRRFSIFKFNSVLIAAAVSLPLFISAFSASADTLLVPGEFPTIQAAVDAALPQDQIRVGPGEWCGATITETVDLFGEGGATIIGCATNPALGPFRIGFSYRTARHPALRSVTFSSTVKACLIKWVPATLTRCPLPYLRERQMTSLSTKTT